ncbi:MAG: tryptophan--tRNA ligase [Candidatus Jorgensenbacteria bacterium]|nr:tryptophan--tRNA ligase [Candidatus Jorgensenbacteria bacterium]
MKPILVSGIQPTGKLHLGNYLGALKNFVELQNSGKYECYFFVADLHSLTEDYNPKEKQKQVLNVALDFLAAGIDPKKSVVFIQSHIPAHSEFTWILNTITPFGDLGRMTQFKNKFQVIFEYFEKKHKKEEREYSDQISNDLAENLLGKTNNVGLFDYPVLMAADILLYDAAFVPIGDDQLQHLELTRTLARKFNTMFGETLIEPKPLLTNVPRLMSLYDPTKKMSKSQPEGCIFIDDSPATIREKIKRAMTDSHKTIAYDPKNRPGLSNLVLIYSAMSGVAIDKVIEQSADKTYSEFKEELAKIVIKSLAPFQAKKKKLSVDMKRVSSALASGNKIANSVASKKLMEIKKKIGLV